MDGSTDSFSRATAVSGDQAHGPDLTALPVGDVGCVGGPVSGGGSLPLDGDGDALALEGGSFFADVGVLILKGTE